jgi:hypothetical protein
MNQKESNLIKAFYSGKYDKITIEDFRKMFESKECSSWKECINKEPRHCALNGCLKLNYNNEK